MQIAVCIGWLAINKVLHIYSNLNLTVPHPSFNCLFGTLGVLDKLHKTDRPFAGSVNEKRHFVSFSLAPVKDIYPEPLKPGHSKAE